MDKATVMYCWGKKKGRERERKARGEEGLKNEKM